MNREDESAAVLQRKTCASPSLPGEGLAFGRELDPATGWRELVVRSTCD